MKVHYRTATMETRREPLDIVTGLASSGIWDTFVVYEDPEGWSVAGGTAAEVLLTPRCIRTTRDGVVTEERWNGNPLHRIREFLADLPMADWTAYGWCAFELAPLLAGTAAAAERDDVLAHLVVPETEVRLSGGRAVVRSLYGAALATVEDAVTDAAAPTAGTRRPVRVDLEAGAADYLRHVTSLVRDIRAGLLQKAVISRVVPVPEEIDFPASFAAGRRANSPTRSFLLSMGGLRAFGFSPETVVEVDVERRVASQPLAGTRALTGDPELDRKLREDLLADPKELHEHAISVKVAVDELAGSCEAETVAVTEFMTVKERGTVQHLASKVVGRLPEGADPWQAFAAVFPAVTASGVPKPAAYEAISRYESQARGPYAGAVMKVTQDGAMDAALVLRSAYARDGRTWLRAGAGVVEQSRAERELEETREKLMSVSRSLVARTDRPAEPAEDTGADETGADDTGAAESRPRPPR
ncbi:putative salicylate synthase [Streptomyces glaucescens]|uniref:Putative salicylate synthase n=1 Tax=Streptomyces glaucescens TaxID=1907 RepID=A0A089X780_STRGA|nr:putative salicylate synthase [Streptomyces glaucescens]